MYIMLGAGVIIAVVLFLFGFFVGELCYQKRPNNPQRRISSHCPRR
jgi:hypothetical protein